MEYLTKPLTEEEIKKMNYEASGVIPVSLGDLMYYDQEELLDMFSELLIGSCSLMDISHKVVGVLSDGNEVLIEVSGIVDPEEIEE